MASSNIKRCYHKEVYRIYCDYLLKHLDIQGILPTLFTNKFIDVRDYERLKRKLENVGPTAAAEEFFENLYRKPGEENFWLFVKCLQESEQDSIADELRRAYNDLHVQYTRNLDKLDSVEDTQSSKPVQETQSIARFAYCIRYYQPDIPDSNKIEEEKMAKDFVKELKLRYIKESRVRNLPIMNIYDDWQAVGKNRIQLIVDTVHRSNVVILLFTDNFQKVKTNAFASDFSCYNKLGKDVVFPIGLASNHDCIPEQFLLNNPLYFQRDWKVDNDKWRNLLNGIFDKIQSGCQMPDSAPTNDSNDQEVSLTTSQPVQESVNESSESYNSSNQTDSTDSTSHGWSRLSRSVSSIFNNFVDYLND